MNEPTIEDRLDAHASRPMPSDVRARLDAALHEYAHPKRSWLPALAAGLFIGLTLGAGSMYALRPDALEHAAPPPRATRIAPDKADPPVRLIVNTSVFSDTRPSLVRASTPSSWGALAAD